MGDSKKSSETQGKHHINFEPSADLEVLSQISFICESRDGRLCLFEDAEGHLTVVRACRLA